MVNNAIWHLYLYEWKLLLDHDGHTPKKCNNHHSHMFRSLLWLREHIIFYSTHFALTSHTSGCLKWRRSCHIKASYGWNTFMCVMCLHRTQVIRNLTIVMITISLVASGHVANLVWDQTDPSSIIHNVVFISVLPQQLTCVTTVLVFQQQSGLVHATGCVRHKEVQ